MANGDTSKEEYIKLFNAIIEQQSVVLGPDIATIIAKKVEGMTFSDDGKVTDISGEPQKLLETLINGYVNLSGMIVRKTIEPLLAKHPSAAAQVSGAGGVPAGKGVQTSEPSTESTQPTAVSEPKQPAVESGPAQPVAESGPAQPAQPPQPSEPAQPQPSGDVIQPVQPTQVSEPGKTDVQVPPASSVDVKEGK